MATQEIIKLEIDPSGDVIRETSGNADLPDEIFSTPVRPDYFWEVVRNIQANRRSGNANTKTISEKRGGGKKPYRQKGTGRARAGNSRTGKRVGGGTTFAKTARDFRKDMPKKQRRLACDSAVLAKLLSGQVVVVDELKFEVPKTKDFASVLRNLSIDRSCVVALEDYEENLYKSARNIPKLKIDIAENTHTYEVMNSDILLFMKSAFDRMKEVFKG